MRGFLIRTLIGAIGLWLAAKLVTGLRFDSEVTILVAAALLGIVNAIVRPVLVVLTFPVTIVTLGLFLLVVNAAMLGLVAWLLDGFSIAGFFPAVLGWIIVALTGWVASWFIGPKGGVEVMVVKQQVRRR